MYRLRSITRYADRPSEIALSTRSTRYSETQRIVGFASRSLQHDSLQHSSDARSPRSDPTASANPETSTAKLAMELPLLPGQRRPRADNIVTDSMQATLEAHRNANLSKMIRKHGVRDSLDASGWSLQYFGGVGEETTQSLQRSVPAKREHAPETSLRRVRNHVSWNLKSSAFPKPYDRLLELDYSCNSDER